MKSLGIIGAGNVGSQLACKALDAGYRVVIANSGDKEKLTALVSELGPNATAGSTTDAAQAGEMVFVSIPVNAYTALPAAAFAGKTVIDTGNYYPEYFGQVPELDAKTITTSELLQRHLVSSSVVKAFNNLAAADLTSSGQAAGTDNRRALTVAGDEVAAKKQVSDLMDSFGFEVIDVGPLYEGWRYQRDLPAYGIRLNAEQMAEALAAAPDDAKPSAPHQPSRSHSSD
jgi:predicted dinucleotide-binding enzyme